MSDSQDTDSSPRLCFNSEDVLDAKQPTCSAENVGTTERSSLEEPMGTQNRLFKGGC